MNYKMMARFLAFILLGEGIFMLPALGISLYDGTTHVTKAFLITLGIVFVTAGLLLLVTRRASKRFFAKEGLFV